MTFREFIIYQINVKKYPPSKLAVKLETSRTTIHRHYTRETKRVNFKLYKAVYKNFNLVLEPFQISDFK